MPLSLGLRAALTPKCGLVLPSTGGRAAEEPEQGRRTARRRRFGGVSPTPGPCAAAVTPGGDQPDEEGTDTTVQVALFLLFRRLSLLLWSTNICLNIFILMIASSLS